MAAANEKRNLVGASFARRLLGDSIAQRRKSTTFVLLTNSKIHVVIRFAELYTTARLMDKRRALAEPGTDFTIWLNGRQQLLSLTALAMNNNGHVLCEIAQDVRLNLVLFVLRIISRHFSAVVAP